MWDVAKRLNVRLARSRSDVFRAILIKLRMWITVNCMTSTGTWCNPLLNLTQSAHKMRPFWNSEWNRSVTSVLTSHWKSLPYAWGWEPSLHSSLVCRWWLSSSTKRAFGCLNRGSLALVGRYSLESIRVFTTNRVVRNYLVRREMKSISRINVVDLNDEVDYWNPS